MTVTIDRRSRDAQRVPASVIAVSGLELERKGISAPRALFAASPYLEVADQRGEVQIYMRGLGDSDEAGIGESAVTTYVDGVYIPRARGFRTLFFDAERVEVGIGPQPTLRGVGSQAGTVHVVNKPAKLGEWSADGSLQLGSYNQRLMRGAVNVPIGSRLALRWAIASENHDAFYENRNGAPLSTTAEDADRWAYRVSGRWEPADTVAVTFRFDDAQERGAGAPGINFTSLLASGLRPSEVPNARAAAFVGNSPSQDVDHWGMSASVELDLGRVGLEALSSYRSLTFREHTGYNEAYFFGSRPPAPDSYADTVWHTRSRTTSNEVRVFSLDSARLRWMIGFFHSSEAQSIFLGQVNDPAVEGRLGQELSLDDVPSGTLAGYVDTTTEITDSFRTIAGFRLASQYREIHGIAGGFTLQCNEQVLAQAQRNDPNARCQPPAAGRGETASRWGTPGFAFRENGRSDYVAGSDAQTIKGAASRIDTFENGVESWGSRDNVDQFLAQPGADVGNDFIEQRSRFATVLPDFRLGGEWDIGERSLAYLTFTTSHRSGGVNLDTSAQRDTQESTYDTSTLYATEFGSKNTFWDKRLMLNGAAFWYAQSNTQVAVAQELDAVNPVQRYNVGDSTVLGLSVDALAYVSHGISARSSVSVIDARYDGGALIDPRDASATPTSIEGHYLPRVPRLTLACGLAQVFPTSVGSFDWSLYGQAKSPMYMTAFNGKGTNASGGEAPLLSDEVPWTTRIDLAVGFSRAEGDLRFDAFVSNLTNTTYMTGLLAAPNAHWRFFNPPRQIGVRVSMYL